MRAYDVIVVGGGPAGSSCARELLRAGLDTLVIDKARFPRDKTCAGWIPPHTLQTLDLSLREYAMEHTVQPIRGFRVAGAAGGGVEVRYPGPISFGIRRVEFDHFLLARCGAELELDRTLESIVDTGEGWELDGELQSRVLVGAGGHFCPIARRLVATQGDSGPVVTAREIEFCVDPKSATQYCVSDDLPELFFEADLCGYGWILRKQQWLNVGLGREATQGLNAALERFLDRMVASGRLPERPTGRIRGHSYRLYGQGCRRPSYERALLVGDALGMAAARSGEGILPAIESGILAARAIAHVRAKPDGQSLLRYDAALEARFGPRRAHPSWSFMPSSLRQKLASVLLQRPEFVRRVVIDRWFVPARAPLAEAPLAEVAVA